MRPSPHLLPAALAILLAACDAAVPFETAVGPAAEAREAPAGSALHFGGGRSRIPGFACWLDQWWRIGLDVRPDRLPDAGAYRLFGRERDGDAEPSLLLLPDGALRFEAAGYVDGKPDTWVLVTPPGVVAADRWQRVEVSYDEMSLRLTVGGHVLAERAYPDSGLRHTRFTALAPDFEGALDEVRCGTYTPGGAPFTDARFDEGAGERTHVGGLMPYTATVERPRWVRRGGRG